ncbi:MAG: VWA domain-containing protein [Myxococcales bacterium]|nr:VWA domain-containing protein [Myxococcales bacterium]
MVPVSIVDVEVSDGAPIADCDVTTTPADVATRADLEGRTRLLLPQPAMLTVNVRCPGHDPVDVPLQVWAHRAVHLTVTPPSGEHVGRTTFTTGYFHELVETSRCGGVGVLTREFLENVPSGQQQAETRGAIRVLDPESSAREWTAPVPLVIATAAPRVAPDRVPVDVVLIVDTSGSMGDELTALTSSLRGMVQRLEQDLATVDLRIGLVSYRDVADLYVTEVLLPTTDLGVVNDTLSRMRANNGGDGPESMDEALGAATWLPFRPDAARVAFLVTDGPPHLERDADVPTGLGVRQAVAAGLGVHTVAGSGLDEAGVHALQQIARSTQGRFLVPPEPQAGSDTLDHLLYDLVRAEVVGYGR